MTDEHDTTTETPELDEPYVDDDQEHADRPTVEQMPSDAAGLRDLILSLDDAAEAPIYIAEWKVWLKVKSMTGLERARVLAKLQDRKGKVKQEALYPEIVAAGVYHPTTDERVFRREDAKALNGKLAGVLERLAIKIMKVSGLDDDAEDDAEGN
ncbi:MAG TPA: hypothetical protein VM307_11260 [Egibacteraceae bacterium]|nr:hypothetical protein [Egibacteraceae bacterium]